MGEKMLTDEMIDEKLEAMKTREIRFIDPMKMAQWTLERCCEMVDNAISTQTIMRAIESKDLEGYKIGKRVTVEPAKFLTWYRRYRK